MTQIGLQLGNLSQVAKIIWQLHTNRLVLILLKVILKIVMIIYLHENCIYNLNNQIVNRHISVIII